MNWKCHQCQAAFEVPEGTTMQFCPQCGAKSEAIAYSTVSPQASVQPENNVCPVCCTPIQPGDDKIVCPDCKMVYHKDCWNDNNGCATYGCHSAGCLNPPPLKVDVSGTNRGVTVSEASNTMVSGGFVCPKCHTQLASGTTFCWSCGNELGAMATLDADVPLAGAWTRWGARVLDYTLETCVVGFFIGMFWDCSNMSNAVAGIIFAPFAFLLDSAVYSIFGNTLGKWIFGIKVIEISGMPVNAGRYFYRNLRVYWGGYGLAIPIATLCTFITQYNRVSKGTPATYDEILNLKSVRYRVSLYQ